ncbi:dihydroflavonol-4-reductase [Apiospora saccharicola]
MAEPTTIPKDSLILVTAVNGLIASHVADQLLAAGYRVRGTVRDLDKCAWMTSYFLDAYGPNRFELMRISTPQDMTDPEVWDEAMRGVSGVAHVLGAVDLSVRDVKAAFAEEWPMHAAVLDAAKRASESSSGAGLMRGFVFTSSAWAAYTPDASLKQTLTEKSWNETAVELSAPSNGITVFNPANADPRYMLAPFMALKTRLEKAFWKWVEEEKPSGAVDGGDGEPQWHIDTSDAGRLYVVALTQEGVDRERIFGFGERFSWFQVRQLMMEWYGPEEAIVPVADLGTDQTEVPNERGGGAAATDGEGRGVDGVGGELEGEYGEHI